MPKCKVCGEEVIEEGFTPIDNEETIAEAKLHYQKALAIPVCGFCYEYHRSIPWGMLQT